MRSVSILLLASMLAACSPGTHGFSDSGNNTGDAGDSSAPTDGRTGDGATGSCPGAAGNVVCHGNTAVTCNGSGGETSSMNCGASQVCVAGQGCRLCSPGAHSCASDGTPQTCNATGDGYDLQAPCPTNQACGAEGVCVDLCADAAAHNSYIGCDYWTTTTANAELGIYLQLSGGDTNTSFPFAVAVANPQTVPATITVRGAGQNVMQTVSPGGLQIIQLPYIDAIAQQYGSGNTTGVAKSVFASNSAYHITSSVPVTLYQFNALSYQDVTRRNCDPQLDTDCFSFTNDASLLLPTNVLSGNVTVVGWPSQAIKAGTGSSAQVSGTSGFMTIVATQDNTNVSIHLTGAVGAGTNSPAGAPGGTISKTMNAGDVWEIMSAQITSVECQTDPNDYFVDQNFQNDYFCAPVVQKDITGSVITASAPVAVFGGHDCAFVPYDRFACDHLEEEMFPNETLGTHYFVSHTQPQLPGDEPNLVRIVSNHDGNMITFTPTTAHPAVTLDRGQYVDFPSSSDFEVNGTGTFTVAQFLVGQNYFGNDQQLDPGQYGDPAMVLEVPVEQWRNSYEFLAPATYPATFVNVVVQTGATVQLDGTNVTGSPTHVGSYDVFRVDISNATGAHRISTTMGEPFAIKVYGFGDYTSYIYAGGLDLTFISPPG